MGVLKSFLKAFLREFLMVVGQIGANSGYAVKDGLAQLLRILHIVRKQPRRLHQPTLKGQFGLINGTIRDLKKKSPVMIRTKIALILRLDRVQIRRDGNSTRMIFLLLTGVLRNGSSYGETRSILSFLRYNFQWRASKRGLPHDIGR